MPGPKMPMKGKRMMKKSMPQQGIGYASSRDNSKVGQAARRNRAKNASSGPARRKAGAKIQEDQPGFNYRTMGNKRGGHGK